MSIVVVLVHVVAVVLTVPVRVPAAVVFIDAIGVLQ